MPRTIRDHSGGRECWSDLALLETGRTYSARGARFRAGRIRGTDCCDAVATIDYGDNVALETCIGLKLPAEIAYSGLPVIREQENVSLTYFFGRT
jgi:hypothetical protein